MKDESAGLDRLLKYWPLLLAVGAGAVTVINLKMEIQENTELAKSTDKRVDYLQNQLTEEKAILNCVVHGCSTAK